MVKLSTIKIYFVRLPGSRALTRRFTHKSPRKSPKAGGSSQKCRNTRAGHTDFDSASPTVSKKYVDYKWQKKNLAKFSDHLCKKHIPIETYHGLNTDSRSMQEEDIAILYNQGVLNPAWYSDRAQSHQKEERKEIDSNGRAGFLSLTASPLLFFYDCESTGANVHKDRIIEIAAEVVGPSTQYITARSFSELCYTPYSIKGAGCGVTDDMLVGSREFSDVFPDFLSWINQCIKETKRTATTPFFPVLVAHNGFVFDFRILAAEVERCNLAVIFNKADLRFADTLFDLRKMNKANDPILSDWSPQERRRLSMSNLHKKYFPGQNHLSTHRALEDVQMMIKIFTASQLNKVIQSLTMRSTCEIISDWKEKHETYTGSR